jgi:hypothetical protein
LRIDATADADTVPAGNINLDCLRDSRWLRGDDRLIRQAERAPCHSSNWTPCLIFKSANIADLEKA